MANFKLVSTEAQILFAVSLANAARKSEQDLISVKAMFSDGTEQKTANININQIVPGADYVVSEETVALPDNTGKLVDRTVVRAKLA